MREAAPKLAIFAYVHKTPNHSHANLDEGGNDGGFRGIQRIALEQDNKNYPQFVAIRRLVEENGRVEHGENKVPIWDFI